MTRITKLTCQLGLLVLCLTATSAFAQSYALNSHQGPSDMVIPVNEFRQFHSAITNVGDEDDSYTMTVTRNQPAEWSFSICYGGLCYPPSVSEFTVPAIGALAPGETVDFDFDVLSLTSEGAAVYTVEIVSNNDAGVSRSWTFEAWTPSEPMALLLAAPEGVIGTTQDSFVQFHPVLYNAGTSADSYTLEIIRDTPATWMVSYCYGGICYPPQETQNIIPADGGTIASGAAVPIDMDFTTLSNPGTGTAVIKVTSNTDPTIWQTATFIVSTGSIVAVDDVPNLLVTNVRAVPNPFNPLTEIRFAVGGDTARDALIDILDAQGRRVRSLRAANLVPGAQSVAWDGRTDAGQSAPAGVYMARVRVGSETQAVKMSLVK